jgi:acid phosphatase
VDSLEPQYSCSSADQLFNTIKSSQNPDWQKHIDLSSNLFSTLDDISGVPSSDGGFHASFDHYYDNLSARQCHAKPLPCKLVNGQNSTTCVSQDLANTVYRLGNWEYSQIYRGHPASLPASVASIGVWIGELTSHLRDAVRGLSTIRYFHNIAHDGSVSRLLSVLQIDEMVWPGMGSEVVFELYKKTDHQPKPSTTTTQIAPSCHHDNCLRHMIKHFNSESTLCEDLTATSSSSPTATHSTPSECGDRSRLASACSCLSSPTTTFSAPSNSPTSISTGYYVRVLFGGKILRSSSPSLGSMNMLPVETLLDYLEGLVGKGGSLIKSKCQG